MTWPKALWLVHERSALERYVSALAATLAAHVPVGGHWVADRLN